LPVVARAEDSAPARDIIAIGPSYSDLQDFGGAWGVRAQWLHGPWMVQGGWDKVNATVTSSTGLPMSVDGNMWSLDLSYLWWTYNSMPEEKPGRPDFYYGLGIGAHNIDATWTLTVDPTGGTNAKQVEPSAHVVVGARWKHFFIDGRYVWCSNFFGYSANGLQGAIGGQWTFGGGE
jgi:hypothetical protein